MKELLKQLKSYKGMDGIPKINKKAYRNIKYIIKKLNKTDFIKPYLYPWSDFSGFKLEWGYLGKYFEINATEEGFETYYEKDKDHHYSYMIENKEFVLFYLREFLKEYNSKDYIIMEE